jgi:hypothetical protein
MMSGGGPNAMMGAAVGMNPMMDMSGMANMNPMAIGPMGMGMSGDMGMQMMQEVPHSGAGGPGGSTSTPEQAAQMAMPDGFNGGGQMGMGMGNEFGMQVCVYAFGSVSYTRYFRSLDESGTERCRTDGTNGTNGTANVPEHGSQCPLCTNTTRWCTYPISRTRHASTRYARARLPGKRERERNVCWRWRYV